MSQDCSRKVKCSCDLIFSFPRCWKSFLSDNMVDHSTIYWCSPCTVIFSFTQIFHVSNSKLNDFKILVKKSSPMRTQKKKKKIESNYPRVSRIIEADHKSYQKFHPQCSGTSFFLFNIISNTSKDAEWVKTGLNRSVFILASIVLLINRWGMRGWGTSPSPCRVQGSEGQHRHEHVSATQPTNDPAPVCG